MKNILKAILYVVTLGFAIGCNEKSFLEEKPLDFASPENSFVTYGDFKSALYRLYDNNRSLYFSEGALTSLNYGTDLGYYGRPSEGNFNNYETTLNSNTGFVRDIWAGIYGMISSSNIIIDRVAGSTLNEDQIIQIEAEARYFRGNAYKVLAHLYGDVPLVVNEVTEPKTDYTRTSREDVYKQAIADLLFAAENLPGISEVLDGEVCDLAAYHMLSEVYLSVDDFQRAIDAATVVIDDPNTALMDARFGTRSNEPGDVYWDLFRRGNQNRSSGNTEGILVAQYELNVFGGVQTTTGLTEPLLERLYLPAPRVFSAKDPDGVEGFIPGDIPHEDTGRGIAYLSPTNYFKYGVWHSDWNDMRNSEYNYVRDLKFTNPNSAWYGENLLDHVDMSTRSITDTVVLWYPYQSKIITVRNYPEDVYRDKSLGTLTTAVGATFTDQYIIRLAETYLLRAEAYLGKGETDNAAIDINTIRSRANATHINASDVDIDFILDERMRELEVEEKRRLTLARLELVYDRVSRLNEGHPQLNLPGLEVQPYHNLWPIPFSEIQSNINAVLVQNPGYSSE